MEKLSLNLHSNLKIIGFASRKSENLARNFEYIRTILSKFGIEIMCERYCAKLLGVKGHSFETICAKTKLIISLGGDGTLISTCREVAGFDCCVLGIHSGTLGFLTDIKIDDVQGFFENFFDAKYDIERPYMLEVRFHKNGEIIKKIAFNDAVIMRKKIAGMAHIEAFLNSKHFNSYFGDGIIVTSPVGSTAYNMSANGPIIYPLSDVFCITPVCSHSLSQRPLLLPQNYFVGFKSSTDTVIVLDGQESFDMSNFELVEVGLSDERASLIRHKGRDYFNVLKEKLRWGN